MANGGLNKVVEAGQAFLLSADSKQKSERAVLAFAIASYLLHLLLIVLANQGILVTESKFLSNPISAIYTPFSFILVYEVYLLLFYLPKSTSFYIGKQYEIITLIVIRRIFKDLGNLELYSNWFQNENDLQFTFDVLTSLLLFFLIYLFYHKILRRPSQSQWDDALPTHQQTSRFVFLKKCIALLLVPVLIGLAAYSFINWALLLFNDQASGITALSNLNNIFFDEFFTILIVVDVLILLASFFYSDRFHTIIRNSGFVLSTILLKTSFSVSGILNNLLIIGAVLFGLLVLLIHQQFEKAITDNVQQ